MAYTMDAIVSLAKRRGFVFPGSEIYGGLANSWDYGPLGSELKHNIKNLWWKTFVHGRDDIVGIDAAIIMNPNVWKASGHVDGFSDPLVECKNCHNRFRADKIDLKQPCSNCGKLIWSEAKNFNLLFRTYIGPLEDSASLAYLRGETAQAMFVDFPIVQQVTSRSLPFGIAQMGKAFRNEITPGNFIFRTREFEQMEIEYFIPKPSSDVEWQEAFEMWRKEFYRWFDVEVDMRVSVVPGNYGESFVMRILDPRNTVSSLDKIAFPDVLREAITFALAKPFGIILTTGPTGSGKTTTLYAFLHHVYNEEVKIITIEDPIEYHLEGLTQTQVEEEKGYTFVAGLRAALRQDPDVIMVGEIRDTDTAKVAINAALTGHLVFSTLHTNNAAGTIPRLIDLGVNSKVIAGALSISLAQRLVRKICENCKGAYESNEKESRVITNILGDMITTNKQASMAGHIVSPSYTLYHAKGCEECSNTGYKGRIGIFEAIIMTPEIETVLLGNPSEREVHNAAKGQKIPSLREDAIIKMLEGQTSFDEIGRVVDLYTPE
jgi:Tfp pilus assembly pilus retraction ATPase PilT